MVAEGPVGRHRRRPCQPSVLLEDIAGSGADKQEDIEDARLRDPVGGSRLAVHWMLDIDPSLRGNRIENANSTMRRLGVKHRNGPIEREVG